MRMTHIMITTLLLSAGLAVPASAGTSKPNEVRTTISKADLETPHGIRKTYHKLQKTAEKSCENYRSTITDRLVKQMCETRLMNDFINDVDHADLTAFHLAQKTG